MQPPGTHPRRIARLCHAARSGRCDRGGRRSPKRQVSAAACHDPGGGERQPGRDRHRSFGPAGVRDRPIRELDLRDRHRRPQPHPQPGAARAPGSGPRPYRRSGGRPWLGHGVLHHLERRQPQLRPRDTHVERAQRRTERRRRRGDALGRRGAVPRRRDQRRHRAVPSLERRPSGGVLRSRRCAARHRRRPPGQVCIRGERGVQPAPGGRRGCPESQLPHAGGGGGDRAKPIGHRREHRWGPDRDCRRRIVERRIVWDRDAGPDRARRAVDRAPGRPGLDRPEQWIRCHRSQGRSRRGRAAGLSSLLAQPFGGSASSALAGTE